MPMPMWILLSLFRVDLDMIVNSQDGDGSLCGETEAFDLKLHVYARTLRCWICIVFSVSVIVSRAGSGKDKGLNVCPDASMSPRSNWTSNNGRTLLSAGSSTPRLTLSTTSPFTRSSPRKRNSSFPFTVWAVVCLDMSWETSSAASLAAFTISVRGITNKASANLHMSTVEN